MQRWRQFNLVLKQRRGDMSIMTTVSQHGTSAFPRRLIMQHPVGTYFVLAYLGAWLSWLPLVLARNGVGVFPFTLAEGWIYGLEVLGSLAGPTAAAFLVTSAISGKEGVHNLLRSYLQWRVGISPFLVVLVGTPLLLVCSISITSLFGRAPSLAFLTQKWLTLIIIYLPFVLINVPGGPLGEEPGWRGVALPHLQHRYGAFLATLIVGVFWGLWHLPLFLVTGAKGPFSFLDFGMFLSGVIFWSVFLTWIFNRTGGSLFMVILLHAVLNTNSSLLDLLNPLFPWLRWIHYVVYGMCALLIVILTKARLSYRPNDVVSPVNAE